VLAKEGKGVTGGNPEGEVTFEEPQCHLNVDVAPVICRRMTPAKSLDLPSLVPSSAPLTNHQNDDLTHQLKQVKRGYRSFSQPRVCGVSFERLPAWLWVLRMVEWSEVVVTRADELRLRHAYPLLFERYGSRWRVADDSVDLHSIAKEAVVWWVSGTLNFVQSLRLPLGVPVVCWITNAPRRTPPGRNTAPHQWLSVSHSKVGGATTARGVFRLTGADRIEIPGDLTRTLSHVIKFSVRSTPCSAALRNDHYKLTSKLSIHRLDLPIVVPSDFSATGWGQRRLEPLELAAAYELPDWVEWDPQFQVHLVRCSC
jgi:hypothetical protein